MVTYEVIGMYELYYFLILKQNLLKLMLVKNRSFSCVCHNNVSWNYDFFFIMYSDFHRSATDDEDPTTSNHASRFLIK